MAEHIDSIVLNFDSNALFVLNVTLAFIMFGIALDLKWINFQRVFSIPKSLIVGLISQLLLLPFLTYLLILLLKPIPSMALGMILVASCPGGNISNFISALSKANVELSIVMTVISSLGSVIFTPLNLAFYGQLYEPTRAIFQAVDLNWWQIIQTILLIIVLPIILGKTFRHFKEEWAKKIMKPFRNLSMLAFLLIVVFALMANGEYFKNLIHNIFFLVLVHNALALFTGFSISQIFRLGPSDKRSITIETGIQNSGLGLSLIFGFFSGLGGMAVIAAWWGVWHIISGFLIAYLFNRRSK